MKTTISGYSQYVVSLGIMSVLPMLLGYSMADSAVAQTSTGRQAARRRPSVFVIKQWIFANLIQLSKVVSRSQADFAKDRLGDVDYANYDHRVPGIPDPTWNLCSLTEQKTLKKTSEELYTIKKFIMAIITHESQNKNSQFRGKFRRIEAQIMSVLSYISQLQTALHYTVTPEPSSPLPTRTPAVTQKKQDEWELGVLKGILWWIIPVQGEFHRHSSC